MPLHSEVHTDSRDYPLGHRRAYKDHGIELHDLFAAEAVPSKFPARRHVQDYASGKLWLIEFNEAISCLATLETLDMRFASSSLLMT